MNKTKNSAYSTNMLYSDVFDLIGHTPLFELKYIQNKYNLEAKILCKLECFNLTGSVKDRTAMAMISDAEKKGLLTNGSTIIEPTSGNTGIALSAIGKAKGYNVTIVMPETFSYARRMMIKSYGANLVLTDGSKGMLGAVEEAVKLSKEIKNSFIPDQFNNESNPKIHYLTTGPEIWNDTDGQIDYLISGVGTGGTITGVGRYLKEKNPNIKIIAVEPFDSAVLSGNKAGKHAIQGIGAGFIPSVLDTKIYDEIIRVKNEEALNLFNEINANTGLSIGISSGAAVYAAINIAERKEAKGKNIVAIMPDSGDRYINLDKKNE